MMRDIVELLNQRKMTKNRSLKNVFMTFRIPQAEHYNYPEESMPDSQHHGKREEKGMDVEELRRIQEEADRNDILLPTPLNRSIPNQEED